MAIKSKLLEHLARRILDRLKAEFPAIEDATIKVRKLNPPLGGKIDFVSVELYLL
jgi:dihydroneopterin aldolase